MRLVHRVVRLLPILVVWGILAGGPQTLPATAQPTTAAPPDASLEQLFRRLATIKGTPGAGPAPPLAIRSRQDTRRFIDAELARRYAPARLEAERKSMVAWGVIPADFDLRRLFVDLMEEQIAAYYDARAKTMVVGDWLGPAERTAALLHELVHALQDRQISLDAFLTPVEGEGDRVLARQALIEGEAVGVMFDVILSASGPDLASLPDVNAMRGQIVAGSLGPGIQRAPPFLRDLLLFPYVEGLGFVHAWRKRNPWSAAAGLYRDPPRSSAQILHPEQYLDKRRDPVAIALPSLDTQLPGFTHVIEDELGEFGLGAVLGLHLGDAGGRHAAAGWRGDRFRVWQEAGGRFAIVAVIVMDGAPEANALALHFTGMVEKRHPELARRGVPRGGNLITWTEAGRAFVVERRGVEVLLVEEAPAATVDGIRAAVWRARPATP